MAERPAWISRRRALTARASAGARTWTGARGRRPAHGAHSAAARALRSRACIDKDDELEAALCASAVYGREPPAGPQWLRGLPSLLPSALAYDKPLCASLDGLALHAATRAGAHHAAAREALLRYVLRPRLRRSASSCNRAGWCGCRSSTPLPTGRSRPLWIRSRRRAGSRPASRCRASTPTSPLPNASGTEPRALKRSVLRPERI